jgi:hypothetical protein
MIARLLIIALALGLAACSDLEVSSDLPGIALAVHQATAPVLNPAPCHAYVAVGSTAVGLTRTSIRTAEC